MGNNSRRKALSWPYARHRAFEDQLRKSNDAWFVKQGFAVNQRMPYLLERYEDWPKNIILPEVAQYIKDEQNRRVETGAGFPLHKYIHHGLSSQAMLFNLVGPMVVHKNLQPLKVAFEREGITWPKGEAQVFFEVEDRKIFNEDFGQPTSIDLAIRGSEDPRALFIEAKLVEREFGSCSVFGDGDCNGSNPAKDLHTCYLHFIGRLYWERLMEHGFLDGLMADSPICPLAGYYQFFREVLFAIQSGGDFVLLYDERNPSFYRGGAKGKHGLMPFLMRFVPEERQGRVHSLSIQRVVEELRRDGGLEWVREFEGKYGFLNI